MTKLTALSSIALLVASSNAFAVEDIDFYFGAGLGAGNTELGDIDNELGSEMEALGVSVSNTKITESDSTYKLFAGVNLSEYFAIEAGYGNFGTYGFSTNLAGTMNIAGFNVETDGQLTTDIEITGMYAALVGQYPINDEVKLYGKLGQNAWEGEVTAVSNITVSIPSERVSEETRESETLKEDGNDLLLAVGVSYQLDQFTVYGEYESIEFDVEDVTSFNLGVIVHF